MQFLYMQLHHYALAVGKRRYNVASLHAWPEGGPSYILGSLYDKLKIHQVVIIQASLVLINVCGIRLDLQQIVT